MGGEKLRIFYRSACPAPSLTFWSWTHRSFDKDCNKWRKKAVNAIRGLHPAIVIVTSETYQQVDSTHFANYGQWVSGLETTLRELARPGRRLVVLGDIPIPSKPPVECIAAHMKSLQQCATRRKDALIHVLGAAERTAAQAVHAEYVDVVPWLCAAVCPPIIHRIIVYRDQFHISATYSLYLRGALRKAIGL